MAFLVTGVSAYRLLKKDKKPEARLGLVVGLVIAAVAAPTQIFLGDLHGLNTLKHQPAKIAAIEAVWETHPGTALTLFGIPDEHSRSTKFAVEIPKLAALVLTHDVNGEIKGLNDFPQHVTEIGRQPWLVTGILTTAQAASLTVTSGQIGITLTMYLCLYLALIVAFVRTLFYLAQKAVEGTLQAVETEVSPETAEDAQ